MKYMENFQFSNLFISNIGMQHHAHILSILNYRYTDLLLSTHHVASSDKITKALRLDRRGMEYA